MWLTRRWFRDYFFFSWLANHSAGERRKNTYSVPLSQHKEKREKRHEQAVLQKQHTGEEGPTAETP